ncbi:undecaprenyl-diphosphate phosphatase [Candidatus Parabeggiatoa sp. HSG14]|uniref:undecaprenyl-diphosphate phosphatase n=1 Tax=Candidatus Parabeggiatoa sp. HSG14 TaxID=3055593 RepID=UPI0025A6BEAE|nr:undecaprenyl-diphosphate phosphatase [Thiotrichales bacterium HSG14]
MDILQIILLAVIQGLTEFLPISSSAHLILFPYLTGWEDQGLAFDIAVHVGSLMAVLMYFRSDLKPLLISGFHSIKTFKLTSESRLLWGVVVGTIPAGLVGLAIASSGLEEHLRSSLIIATATIVFGLLLWWADVIGTQKRDEYTLTWQDILLIGLAQALALIPGTSRSGITITAALLVGLSRKAAARFSFLLAIPIIMLAGAIESLSLANQNIPVNWYALLLAVIFSWLSAYLCIHLFISFLDRIGMLPFVLYRLVLGVILLIWLI